MGPHGEGVMMREIFDAEEIKKDASELREIADFMGNHHEYMKENADFLREIATGIENLTEKVEQAIHILTPHSEGGDGGAWWWDGCRARNILKGLGDPGGGGRGE
jgi:hypothetical protein